MLRSGESAHRERAVRQHGPGTPQASPTRKYQALPIEFSESYWWWSAAYHDQAQKWLFSVAREDRVPEAPSPHR